MRTEEWVACPIHTGLALLSWTAVVAAFVGSIQPYQPLDTAVELRVVLPRTSRNTPYQSRSELIVAASQGGGGFLTPSELFIISSTLPRIWELRYIR